jgi:hypothetical protein
VGYLRESKTVLEKEGPCASKSMETQSLQMVEGLKDVVMMVGSEME